MHEKLGSAVPLPGGPGDGLSRTDNRPNDLADDLARRMADADWFAEPNELARPVRLVAVRPGRHSPDWAFPLRQILATLEGQRPTIGVVTTGSLIAAIMQPAGSPGDGALAELLGAAVLGTGAVAVAASTALRVSELHGTCEQLTELSRLHARQESPAPVVFSNALVARRALLRLVEFAGHQPEIMRGRIARLLELDESTGSDLAHTLDTFFRCSLSVGAASQALFVHPNTLRYRLRKIQAEIGLDITDANERLIAEVQLRCMLDRPTRPRIAGFARRS